MIPVQKNIKNPPGQIVNYPKCRAAADGGCYCDGSCMRPVDQKKDEVLKDYIHRKDYK